AGGREPADQLPHAAVRLLAVLPARRGAGLGEDRPHLSRRGAVRGVAAGRDRGAAVIPRPVDLAAGADLPLTPAPRRRIRALAALRRTAAECARWSPRRRPHSTRPP